MPYKTKSKKVKKTISQDVVNILSGQALNEIAFSRKHKKKRLERWKKIDEMYEGVKPESKEERANVELAKMQEFVHTLLSKVDTPLIFKYSKKKNSDLMRAERANALRRVDANEGDWDMKDLIGKKQGIMYGRAIYSYHAENTDGVYQSVLENVDVRDFLIDPAAGGLEMENAMYMGRANVIITRQDLEEGAKSGVYRKDIVKQLLAEGGNSQDDNEEQLHKDDLAQLVEGERDKEIGHEDKYKFYEWWTTYKGERYYLVMTTGGHVARCERWKELSSKGYFPFWSWAAYPSLTEFWTPSYCDYVREIFMAQAVSINQMLDNAEQINKPQKAIDVNAIVDETELKYKKNGVIRLRSGENINNVFKIVETPSINTPLEVYQALETIGEKSSGVNAAAKGMAEEDKVTIYKGNLQNMNDRFNLFNKSYTHGYKRMAKLYYEGIVDKLTKKVAIELTGPDGVQIEEITNKDIQPRGRCFNIIVESSNSELEVSHLEKQAKEAYLLSVMQDPTVNHEKVLRLRAELANIAEEEIEELFDLEGTGDARLMAEAERDIETILDGKTPPKNYHANLAYKKRFVDYMQTNSEYLDDEQFAELESYIRSLDEIIIMNMQRKAMEQRAMRDAMMEANGIEQPQQQEGGMQGGGVIPQEPQQGGMPDRGPQLPQQGYNPNTLI
jgi:hypothetical protein